MATVCGVGEGCVAVVAVVAFYGEIRGTLRVAGEVLI